MGLGGRWKVVSCGKIGQVGRQRDVWDGKGGLEGRWRDVWDEAIPLEGSQMVFLNRKINRAVSAAFETWQANASEGKDAEQKNVRFQ